MSELRTRVEELKMENEYQLRLKDMNYNEKIKDLTDKFIQEIEALKAKNEVKRISLIIYLSIILYALICVYLYFHSSIPLSIYLLHPSI